MKCMQDTAALVGRLLLGGVFLYSGIGSLMNLEGFVGATASKLPYPEFFAVAAIAIKIVGGLLIVLGLWVQWAAVALAVFTVIATALYHTDFSDFSQMLFFQKNLMITGGLFLLMAFAGGKYTACKLWDKVRQA